MPFRAGASDARSSLLLAGQNQALQLALGGAALGKVLGTLALYYREARGPSAHDRETVALIGSTAGLVVENARLYGELEDLNHRARLAAEAGGLGFFTWEVTTDRVSWQNDKPYAIFGISPSEGPINAERFVSDFLHPDDQQAFADAVTQALDNGARFHFRGRIRQQATGDIRHVEFTGQLDPEARERGSARIVGIVADV